MVSGPAPEYTPEAIERGVEGSMQVRCVVTTEGNVRGCKVMKGLPFMNSAVITALEKRKYRPAVAQGKAVDVFYTFILRLKLPAR
jgi:protein TonB